MRTRLASLPLHWVKQESCHTKRSSRLLSCTAAHRQVQQAPSPTPGPTNNLSVDATEPSDDAGQAGGNASRNTFFEAAVGTAAGVALIGLGGVAYHSWYKYDVLRKIGVAFEPGYDPILELDRAAKAGTIHPPPDEGRSQDAHLRRAEQPLVDRIVDGKESGHYYLMLGAKGVGKSTMIVDAMRKNDADGVAVCEAHEDPEIFRLRLGKCLNFEFNEDYYGGLFSRKDPRDAGPLLDIERVLNKLEKVAIRYARKRNRPLVLVFNNIHFLHNDEDGHSLLHALQQRAEAWAAARTLSVVFCSDDFHIYETLKKNASRMEVLNVKDLSKTETMSAIRQHRPDTTMEQASEVFGLLGGRLAFLTKVVKKQDIVQAARDMIQREKEWLLARRNCIPDHDDDVMDAEKESSCAWLLFQELAKRYEASLEDRPEGAGENDAYIPYWKACEVMTRPDFLEQLDVENMIQIDVDHRVRADSVMLLNAMREVVAEEDFEDRLNTTRDRVDAIESLHRTRELVIKDNDGTFKISLGRG